DDRNDEPARWSSWRGRFRAADEDRVHGFETLVDDIDADRPQEGIGEQRGEPSLFPGGQFRLIDLLQPGGERRHDVGGTGRRGLAGGRRRDLDEFGIGEAAESVIEQSGGDTDAFAIAAAVACNRHQRFDRLTGGGLNAADARLDQLPPGVSVSGAERRLVQPAVERSLVDTDRGRGARVGRFGQESGDRGLLIGGQLVTVRFDAATGEFGGPGRSLGEGAWLGGGGVWDRVFDREEPGSNGHGRHPLPSSGSVPPPSSPVRPYAARIRPPGES